MRLRQCRRLEWRWDPRCTVGAPFRPAGGEACPICPEAVTECGQPKSEAVHDAQQRAVAKFFLPGVDREKHAPLAKISPT